jgi:endo-1,4-beta-xylanase
VVHPEPARWEFEPADRVLDFAEADDMEVTATHLVWDPPMLPEVLPDWVRQITDPDELRSVMRDHLAALHERYRGRIDRWIVVNEPLDVVGNLEQNNHYLRVLGPGYLADAFRMADEIWPEAQLVLNDVVVEYFPAKAEALVALVSDLLDEGVPVDRVGLQAHLLLGEPNWELLESTMHQIAELGIPVDITELDVPLVPITKGSRCSSTPGSGRNPCTSPSAVSCWKVGLADSTDRYVRAFGSDHDGGS